ncbi:RodZ family helix-turn-helix domain-containing protein [Pedobacter gandavensis]|uniref:Uncharacterized protein n=1 Tax=Pedobacter gandavensis TaxID=2679963 RepID=A0ABR6EXF9_9SPHI|nr:hypothetical protein [Pedobacter gandavensis]MBB2149973.1 hypothetical protein [Pedobacter gandavensis]
MKRILYISCFVLALSACNSEPKQSQNVVTPTPGGLPSASPTMVSGEKPANNPAHGQPFHDCALPVGAPLNAQTSTPANGPVNVNPTPGAPVVAPQTAPATAPSAPVNQAEAKLNPAHGLPGHDCAIPVGAPLS